MTHALIHAKMIVAQLARAGHIAYFAGGWVRDSLMGLPSEDIDIATDASPSKIMDLFPHTILVGLTFGVVIVVIEGHPFEVATFRKDLPYVDGRHPQGIEISTPLEDALRRDFTINGMFYDPLEGVIHDFVEGREDIRRGIIRTIGDPRERFFEDRLRMLRAFRFSARFAFTIDLETQEAIRENIHQLFPAVAMERVWLEFNKMALSPRFDEAIVKMHALRLLDVIFPEMAGIHIKELRQRVNRFSHFPPDCPTILYLMEILMPVSFLTRIDTAKRLKISNKDLEWVEFLERLDQAVVEERNRKTIDRHQWAILLAHPGWKIGIKVLAARYATDDPESFFQCYVERHQQLEPHIRRLQEKTPLMTATILQKQGILPGKRMGMLLKEAERIAINENLHEVAPLLAKLSELPLWKS